MEADGFGGEKEMKGNPDFVGEDVGREGWVDFK